MGEVDDDAQARLEKALSAGARKVCRVLQDAGHAAWAVGGAVRDALLGREVGDWDVATSARPDEVQALFSHTIPTGIEHGTVTAVIGRGRAREAIEVTSFRGEGEYSDARRPDEVTFGVSLDEDLARRDFVINAIAYDPVPKVIRDPFAGRRDLARRLVRAVGAPERRFREDGLRVMRALRFVAQLDFELEEQTEGAIPGALDSLANVARERVYAELSKLVAGPAAARALAVARRRGVLEVALPELAERVGRAPAAAWEDAFARLAAAPSDAGLRLAALVLPAEVGGETSAHSEGGSGRGAGAFEDRRGVADAEELMRGLRASNAERKRVCHLAAFGLAPRRAELGPPDIRRIAGRIGRERAGDLALLWRAEGEAGRSADASRFLRAADAMEEVLARRDPVSARDLALSGDELMRALELEPGPAVGTLIAELVDEVCEDPARNTREALVALARERAAKRSPL